MRYSISNAIPHNPKSKKHPYENLVNTAFWVLFFFSKAVDSLCGLLKSTGNSIICLVLCQWIADISKRSSEITVP